MESTTAPKLDRVPEGIVSAAARPALLGVDDFVIGKPAPRFKVIVREIVFVTDDFIVFLDDQDCTYWWTRADLPRARGSDFNKVLNRVAELEAIPVDVLTSAQRRAFRTLIAEGIARALDEEDTSSAAAVHDKAEQYVRARLGEVARFWYLRVALFSATLVGVAMSVLAWLRSSSNTEVLDLSITVLAGALGAAFSLLTRAGGMQLDPAAGARLHTCEAIGRISSGALGALVVTLTLRSGLVLPALQDAGLSLVVLLCLVSGVSERLVPTLVSQLERQFSTDDTARATKQG